MKNSNIKNIMENAHEMTRKTIQEYPGADYRATFAAALRISWKETGKTAAQLWESYTDAEKLDALQRMTFFEYGRRDARYKRGENGEPVKLANYFIWIDENDAGAVADALESVAQESYLYLAEYLNAEKYQEKPLAVLLSRAVLTAARKIARAEKRNPSALRTRTDKDGNIYQYEADGEPIAEPIAPDAYTYTITRDAIRTAAHDDIDREIITGLALGYSRRAIARAVGMNINAINYRVNKLRARYESASADARAVESLQQITRDLNKILA